jgi:hypothetical protein
VRVKSEESRTGGGSAGGDRRREAKNVRREATGEGLVGFFGARHEINQIDQINQTNQMNYR